MSLYPSVRVQVRFPEGFILTASFHLKEHVSDIVAAVRHVLQPTCPSFKLVSAPRRILEVSAELYDERLFPAAALKLQWQSTPPATIFTKEALLLLQEEPSPVVGTAPFNTQRSDAPVASKPSTASSASSSRSSSTGKKVPKWMKLAK